MRNRAMLLLSSKQRVRVVWVILLFALLVGFLVLYYTITSVSPQLVTWPSYEHGLRVPSEYFYLNKRAFMNSDLGYIHGNCPYLNPAYPSIGPDISILCPENKAWGHGIEWYFDKTIKNLNPSQQQDYRTTLNLFNYATQVMQTYFTQFIEEKYPKLYHNQILKLTFEHTENYHLAYQYLSCQTENEILTILNNWNNIIKNENYKDIFNKYNKEWKSWSDIEICFDKILCMNDGYSTNIRYNLYLDYKSQQLLKELINRTESYQEKNYDIKLSFYRNMHQQSFHVTFASVGIPKTRDRTVIDYNGLMNYVNDKMKKVHIPCLKLGISPQLAPKSCKTVNSLTSDFTFDQQCQDLNEIGNAH